MTKSFRKAARNILTQYRSNVVTLVYSVGNGVQTAAIGFGGDWYQTAGGLINYGATVSGLTLSHTRLGFCPPFCFGALAMTVQQWPLLASGDLATWAVHGMTLASFAPCIAEPFMQEKAAARLAAFRATGKTLLQRFKDRTQRLILKTFAKPRVSFSIMYGIALGCLAANDFFHGRTHLLPVYALWGLATGMAAGTKPKSEITKPCVAKTGPVP